MAVSVCSSSGEKKTKACSSFVTDSLCGLGKAVTSSGLRISYWERRKPGQAMDWGPLSTQPPWALPP